MVRHWLRDDQFERIEAMLPGKRSDPGRTAEDNRLFVCRSGALDRPYRQPVARPADGVRPLE